MSDQDLYPDHEESGLPLVLWIVPLLAVIVAPSLVWSVAERPMAMRFNLAFWTAVGVALVGTVLLAILSRGFKQRLRWALSVTAVAVLVLFQWPILTFAGSTIAKALRAPLLTNASPVLIAFALLWLATRNGSDWQFPIIVGVGTLVIVGVLVKALLPVVELGSAVERGAAAPDSPDVLLLVLDGYLRSDILRDELQFDNSAFVGELEQLGFTVPTQTQSNYGYTSASVSTMLNLDYVYDLGPITDEDNSLMRNAMSGNPPMMDLFRRAGYEIALLENAWEGSHCGAAVDICVRDGLTERVLWRLGEITIFAPVLRYVRPHPFNSVSYAQLVALESHVMDSRTDGVPRLTVAHIVMPHPPFLRDGACEYHNTNERRSFTAADEDQVGLRREMYTDQLTCTNANVVDAIRQIVDARPDTIIMITGDHGSATTRVKDAVLDEWSYEGLIERVSILSAYRLPDCRYEPYPTITPVNGTRIVTNCALNAQLGPLPDRTMWAPPEGGSAEVVTLEAKVASSLTP